MSSSDGDQMDFSVFDGLITDKGDLVGGGLGSYYLNVDGVPFRTPSGITKGRLVGKGAGAPIPTGAIGTFNYVHGNAVVVQGVFGADIF